ncbi:hypothetical protein [Kibdelosporangium philippinense]
MESVTTRSGTPIAETLSGRAATTSARAEWRPSGYRTAESE